MKNKRKPFKLGTAGVVIVLLVAGLATAFSIRALMADGFFTSFADAASLAAAKKKAPAKKKVTKPAVKKPAAKPAAPAAAKEPALPAIPVGASTHDGDFPLACGSYNETLVASDYTTPGVNGGIMADQKRRACITRIIRAFMYDYNDHKYPAYPEEDLIKLFGVRSKFLEQQNNTTISAYYFNGNAIYGPYGDAFSTTPPCYSFTLKDMRKSGNGWSFGQLNGPDPSYCGK